MGVDVRQMAKMFDSGQIDKAKLRQMGPDMVDMMDVFRKLAEIK